jgi:hypothetical protein
MSRTSPSTSLSNQSRPFYIWPASLLVLALAGCAAPTGRAPSPFQNPALSIVSAQSLITPGQSTRSDVMAALGPATVVTFDSGFEILAYRTKPTRTVPDGSELVILIDPSGVVRKTRVRNP